MNFRWDERKRESNLSKHGLDFVDAPLVFDLPMLRAPDTRYDYGEDRYLGIGWSQGRVVVVVFTQPESDTIRIISLRKALGHERKRFEDTLKNRLG